MSEMMGDSVIQNAQQAAAEPANGAPDEREARRAAIARDPDFLNAGPRKEALLSEMRALTGVSPKAAAVPGHEQERLALTKALIDPKLTGADREATMEKLRALVAQDMTAEERDAVVNLDTRELRERFGLQAPPKHLADRWDSEAEGDALARFAADGVSPKSVRAVMGWYSEFFTNHAGDPNGIDVEATIGEFRQVAKREGLHPKLVEDLINWSLGV